MTWQEMQTREGMAVDVTAVQKAALEEGRVCMWGLRESPTHLEAAVLVLDPGKVRGCFILYSCPVRGRLSESLY